MSATRGGVGALVAVCAVLLGGCAGSGGGTGGPTASGPAASRPAPTAVSSGPATETAQATETARATETAPATQTPPGTSTPATGSRLPSEATFTPQGTPSTAELQEIAGQLQRRAQAMGLAGAQVEVRDGTVSLSAVGATSEQFTALAQQGHLGFRPVLAYAPSGLDGTPAQGAVPPDLTAALKTLNCSDAAQRADHQGSSTAPAVACGYAAQNGIWYGFALGPVAVDGKDVSAVKAVQDTQNGGGWQVDLTFDAVGAREFADVTGVLAAQQAPTNEFAIVLDGVVVSHPYVASAVAGGEAVISGGFTEAEARRLAALIADRLPAPLRLTEIVIPQ